MMAMVTSMMTRPIELPDDLNTLVSRDRGGDEDGGGDACGEHADRGARAT